MKTRAEKYNLIIAIVLILFVCVLIFRNKNIASGCAADNLADKQKCWESEMQSAILKNDINYGFELVEQWYAEDSEFGFDCHGIMHALGESAYKLYSRNESFNVTAKTSYCGFGFYHSFMESLLLDGNDMKKATSFCDYIDKKLRDKIADAKGACFHGIGHGAADNHIIKGYNNEEDLVLKPLELCVKAAPTDILINRCASGVFNVLAIKYSAGELKINQNDPLWYCRTLERAYFKKPCYEEMNTALMNLFRENFIEAAKFIENITEDEFAMSGIRSLTGAWSPSLENPVIKCRSLQNRLQLMCIRGFAAGMIETGQPGLEYVKALEFCEASGLTALEEKNCHEEVLWLSSNYYSADKYRQICELIKKDNEITCSF